MPTKSSIPYTLARSPFPLPLSTPSKHSPRHFHLPAYSSAPYHDHALVVVALGQHLHHPKNLPPRPRSRYRYHNSPPQISQRRRDSVVAAAAVGRGYLRDRDRDRQAVVVGRGA